ncbi:MAG: RNA methyltransferase [Phycisphaeraceae bacterium]|nr:RNA methyltransferase [Phycisphaeraceae bacterium]
MTIDSLDDPRVAVYRNVRDADLVGRRGVFLAEGELVVRALLERHRTGGAFRARSLLLGRTRFDAMADALGGLGADCPVFVVEQDVMDAIVGFHIHRGALACGERVSAPTPGDIVRPGSVPAGPVVVLEDIANHDNIGGIFRNAAAFGASGVLLNPRCCDPLYRKALRVSMGHVLSTPYAAVESVESACAALHDAGWVTLALTPDPAAPTLRELIDTGGIGSRTAALLGAEGPGLTDGAMGAARRRARIPMAPGVDSLNVVVACAITLSMLREAAAGPR